MFQLEVCVDSIEGALTAVHGGADRIELCSALALGGLTPSVGLIKAAAQLPVPCMAMIRPKAGNFRFDKADIDIMLADIDAVRSAGLAGVVLGAQADHGGLDLDMLQQLTQHTSGLSCTLHRVVDVLIDPLQGVEDAIALGFERVLTSGGCASATDGRQTIAAMHRRAGGAISIMPGSGLNAGNVHQVLEAGVHEVHASCSVVQIQQHGLPASEGDLSAGTCETSVTSLQKVSDLKLALQQYTGSR